jgi:hypothetical protein
VLSGIYAISEKLETTYNLEKADTVDEEKEEKKPVE